MGARGWARTGALAGIVTIFLALVGLIGEFTDVYLIGDEITFAGLMLVLPAFVAGMVAAAPRIEAGVRREMRVGEAAAAAAVAAAAAGGVFAVAVLLTDLIGVERIRTVFIKISPQLMEFLTFGRSTVGGARDHRRGLDGGGGGRRSPAGGAADDPEAGQHGAHRDRHVRIPPAGHPDHASTSWSSSGTGSTARSTTV